MATGMLYILCSLSLFFLFYNIHNCVSAQHYDEIPKIGIVGGGLGGASAAYYLRQLFGSELQVDVIEGERVGGRLALINIDGQDYEAGGTVIHPRNAYMVNFTQQFGLEKNVLEMGTLGLYNNEDGLFFQTSRWTPVTVAKMLWRHGWDVKLVQDFVVQLMVSFDRIYEFQNQGMAFTSVEDLLRAMSEKFVNYTRISGQTMLKDAGFSDRFNDEIAMGAMRDNYGQTTNSHGFVTAVSLAGVENGLWNVKGGNKLVVEKLLKEAGANLIQGKVIQVDQVKSEGGTVSYEVQYQKDSAQDSGSKEYDIVIMATPLQSGSKLKIKFEEFSDQFTVPNIPFHNLEAVYVHGTPNISYFGIDKLEDFPANIMTTDPGVFFNKMSKQSPVSKKEHLAGTPDNMESCGVWKVFLNKVPSELELISLFDSRKDLRIVNWLAYPEYSPKMMLPSFVLQDRLYFINAIEAAATAMEMSVIGAKNVALLAYNQWFGHFERIDEFTTDSTGDSGFATVGNREERTTDEL